MNTFSNAFRTEVVRMARKELKPELQSMRKALTAHRSEIAALKRDVKSLTSQLKASTRQSKSAENAASGSGPTESAPRRKAAFGPQALADKRTELGLSQKDMAKLLQASSLSVYKWETGKVQPRAAQLERIAEVLKMGKRKARAVVSGGVEEPAEAPSAPQ